MGESARKSSNIDEIGPKVGGVDAARLRSLVERIEQADTEIKELNELKSSIYDEAEPEFDKNALKQVVKRRRKERNVVEAEDHAVAVYERALAGWESTPLGSAFAKMAKDIKAGTVDLKIGDDPWMSEQLAEAAANGDARP